MDISCSFFEISLRQQAHHSIFHPDSNPTSSELPATVSLLQDLTILAESTLQSVCDFLFSTPTPFSTSLTLGRCPFDCCHLMPPESLFLHSLTCSSAPGSRLLDLGFLDNLRYPKSLKTVDQFLKENLFVRPFPEAEVESEVDTCFSLDDELEEIDSNFFYRDCPGVVTTPEPDTTGRTFTLPSILFTECANLINDYGSGRGGLDQKAGILPSDYWTLRTEVQSWSNIPSSISFTALLVAAALHKADKLGMKRWVILNSPRFGISIDSAMRDHIFLLLKLCLKAVRREAFCSLKLVLEAKGFLDSTVVRYECPHLVSSITWLACQISVLYSEENGKLFVLGMLKESFLLVGRHLMVFMKGKENANCLFKVISSNSECSGGEYSLGLSKSTEIMEVKSNKPSESSGSCKVFVSQVASAIAALHERFLLEKRVQALRFSQRLPRFQLINEYISTSIRASQKRARRPNYRPLLEHDGLLWQRQNMQEFTKSKTREELLAEERDYKRRRMSYRGKKVKRNTMQVLHDIIEGHMEEIKQAGGIGCNVKIASECTLISNFDRNKDLELKFSANNAYETSIKKPLDCASNFSVKARECYSSKDGSSSSCFQNSHYGTRNARSEEHHKLEKNKWETQNFNSRSPSYHDKFSSSSKGYSQKHNGNDWSPCRDKYVRKNSDYSYKTCDSRSTLTSKFQEVRGYEYNCAPESRKSYSSRASEKQWVDSTRKDMLEDRYEPFRSNDNYDSVYERFSESSHSVRSQKLHKVLNDIDHHDAHQRSY